MRDTLKYSSDGKSVPQPGWSDCLYQPDCTCSLVKLKALCIVSPSSQLRGLHMWRTKPKLHDANMMRACMCNITDQQSKTLQSSVGMKGCYWNMSALLYHESSQKFPVTTLLPWSTAKRWQCSIHHPPPTPRIGRHLPATMPFTLSRHSIVLVLLFLVKNNSVQ